MKTKSNSHKTGGTIYIVRAASNNNSQLELQQQDI